MFKEIELKGVHVVVMVLIIGLVVDNVVANLTKKHCDCKEKVESVEDK